MNHKKKYYQSLLLIAQVSMLTGVTVANAEDALSNGDNHIEASQTPEAGVSGSEKNNVPKAEVKATDAQKSEAKPPEASETSRPVAQTSSTIPTDAINDDSLKAEGDNVESQAKTLVQQVKDNKRQEAEQAKAQANAVKPGDVRVDYIPEIIKQQIKDQLRGELQQTVLDDLIKHAQTERWGIPDANPEWFSRIKFNGDVRLRAEDNIMGNDNIVANNTNGGFENWTAINQHGGYNDSNYETNYFNSWEDQLRYRIRARLGIDAQVSTSIKSHMRLSTGNTSNPVSTNQTMGQYGNRYTMVWDRLYLQYKGPLNAPRQWLTLTGGRMANPWFSTDLIWDSDLAFDGVAASFDINLHGSESLDDINETDRTLFFTAGLFPLQEIQFSKKDKYLLAAQLGTHWVTEDQSSFKLGLAYYNYQHITGRKNDLLSYQRDYTAPEYMQKGNLVFDIRNDTDPSTDLWALASDYKELALTSQFDMANFSPVHVVMTAEYVTNIGFNKNDILNRTGGSIKRSGGFPSDVSGNVNLDDILSKRPSGFQVKVSVGWPQLTLPGNWRASLAYKRIEGDAVLDAFTDSDFHMGGTNAKGWILGYERGIDENTWLSAKYISSQNLSGTVFDVETIQLDINAKF